MCALSGMRNKYSKIDAGIYHIKGKTGNSKGCYYITINPNKYETKVSERSFSIVDYDGLVWCVNNRNTTLIIRRNGKISIQGNCKGEAADLSIDGKARELLELIEENHLPFDQAILYRKQNFLHVSLKVEGEQREQIIIK